MAEDKVGARFASVGMRITITRHFRVVFNLMVSEGSIVIIRSDLVQIYTYGRQHVSIGLFSWNNKPVDLALLVLRLSTNSI